MDFLCFLADRPENIHDPQRENNRQHGFDDF